MLKRIIYIFILFISIKTVAQRTTSSPYSFFGIGQEYRAQTVEQSTMGGIGVAFSDSYHLNYLNPASNANLRLTTYTFGVALNQLTVKNGATSQSDKSISLSYFNLGFPIGDKAGFIFGIQPNTSIGYSLINSITNTSGDVIEATRFYGEGGTNRIYGSYGMHIFKNLTLGVEADYIFGKTENSVTNQRVGVYLAAKNNETTIVRGGGVKIGMQYKKALQNNKLVMSFGAVVSLQQSLKTTGSEYLYSVLLGSGGEESPRDTISSTAIKGNIELPVKTSLGFGLGKPDIWYAGVNYEYQDAFNVQGALLNTSSTYKYGSSNRFSLGGFYLPKINSISSYWDRVTYRAGFRFENTGLLVNGTNTAGNFTKVKDFGISFGLGLPMQDLSNINLGVEYGQKGSTANNLIKENYFNFRLSLSLNAKWFHKRRID